MNLSKKTLSITMLVCLVLILPAKTVYAANIPIFVDNVPAYSEVSPFYSNDTLLVPVRLISEELGATVDWQDEQISISGNDCNILLYVGQNQAEVNGTSQNLSAPPQIVQGHLFVPLRFIGETLGAEVLYRDGKIFLYSTEYDEKNFLYDGPDEYVPCMHKPNYIKYDNKIFLLENDTIKIQDNENGKEFCLPIYNSPKVILAISKGGLIYTNATMAYGNDRGTFYYNFANQKVTTLFNEPLILNSDSNFNFKGYLYFLGDKNFSQSIFSADIDGTNVKEIFIEESNYRISDMQSYNGWIYYLIRVPVVVDYGIDYYIGSLNRVRIDGTNKQQLTDEYISQYYFTDDGIYYEYAYGRGSGLLKYEDLD